MITLAQLSIADLTPMYLDEVQVQKAKSGDVDATTEILLRWLRYRDDRGVRPLTRDELMSMATPVILPMVARVFQHISAVNKKIVADYQNREQVTH